MDTAPVLWAAVGVVLGALIGFWVSTARERARQRLEKQRAQDEASRILERAKDQAESVRKAGELAGREEGIRLRDRALQAVSLVQRLLDQRDLFQRNEVVTPILLFINGRNNAFVRPI